MPSDDFLQFAESFFDGVKPEKGTFGVQVTGQFALPFCTLCILCDQDYAKLVNARLTMNFCFH